MGAGEWRLVGAMLLMGAAAAAAALAIGVGAAVIYGAHTQPIYQAMAGLGVIVILGLAAASRWAAKKAGPAPDQPKKSVPPGAWAHAALVSGVVIGSGGATAAGLNDWIWLGGSVAVSALYSLYVVRPRLLPE
jgi:hypothetical protein